MIWRFSLPPRLVEIKCELWKGNRRYYSRAALPSAFYVCHDSRNVVTPCYPRYFGTELYSPTILFNPSLDTLYLEQFYDEELFEFFEDLGGRELVRLENIAISEIVYGDFSGLGDDIQVFKYWKKLGIWIRLPALRNLLMVQDIAMCLVRVAQCWDEEEEPERMELLGEFSQEYYRYDPDLDRCVEVFDQFPEELIRHFDFATEEVPDATDQSKHMAGLLGNFDALKGEDEAADDDLPVDSELVLDWEWLEKRTRAVWGWRRVEHPDIAL
ncbi:uncharacterized protein PAC_12612 [Phialocephala subalpina]|uniref:2EXR domain-containing protein n=1 Tax=Phialocephala subalpina TaxID=576137 RepID=A0A1L7XCH3_9HELO|nr:uncharacterized protein PAC_12612 [Phialocephala subalpina]